MNTISQPQKLYRQHRVSDRRVAPSQPRPGVGVYRRRRAMVAVAAAVMAAVTFGAFDALAGSGGVPASAAGAVPAHERVTVIAQPGDTLWDLAAQHRGDISLTRYVDKLVDLNGGASIQAGQLITLP